MSPKKQLKMASRIGAAAAFFLALAISTGGCSSYNVVPDNVTFDYGKLGPDSGDLILRGNSSLMSTGLELNVRPSGPLTGLIGRATYSTPVRLWDNFTGNSASFTTSFTFSIQSNNTQSADGFAFFLAPNGSYNPPNNSSGGAIGLVDALLLNGTLPPSAAFVAIEVDTFANPWDPSCRHLGIDINSISSVNSTCVDWLDGMIMSGGLINASITYDSSSGNLSAVLTDNGFPGNNAAVSHVVGLKEYLPEQVVIGFAASTGASFELHTIKSWDFSSDILVAEIPRKGNTATVLAVSISGSILVFGLILGFAWCRFCSRKEMQEEEDDIISIDQEFGEVAGPKRFSYEELVNATDGFHEGRLLGRGGFGKVYEGIIRGTGLRVAIKRISPESKQGVKEYATEVITISQLRHRNLVQLIGWCHRKKDLLLIYEFMSNGSLDSHLFHSLTPMSWGTSFRPLMREAITTLNLDSPLPTFPPAFWNELYAGSSYVPQSSSHMATTTGSGSTFSIESTTHTASSSDRAYSSTSALLKNTN
ncbi:hypothetical protein MLD38_001435 [Melastoma candidum]|uniref:Uncharacterized protein n=1 Tax=Melastoma candidum TaxID=119954 RepID=A0ACB9SGJ7_9MYRT|nr:hypothetical protein MLD38_001435 [Melastoma candidum]